MGHRLPGKAQLENHGKLLIIERAEQDDSGKYMCKAKNPLGEAVHYFTVAVEGNSSVVLFLKPTGINDYFTIETFLLKEETV